MICLESLLSSKEIINLNKSIEDFLDAQVKKKQTDIEETQYEQLDSRLQVVESFLDSIESVSNKNKNLS